MNSVFAAATLACVSQALRLNAEPTAIPARVLTHGGNAPEGSECHFPFEYKNKTYNSCTADDHSQEWCYVKDDLGGQSKLWGNCPKKDANPPSDTPDEQAPSSDDEHAGHAETFVESLESEEMHNEWRTHQVQHQTENAHLASEREARTTEYFAALAASHGADAAVVHATAQETAADAALHTATANAAAADAKWTEADRVLHQTREELAGAHKAMEAARAHHTKVIGDAHGAQDAAEKKHSGLVADASDELAKATAAEGAAHSAKTHAEDVAKTAHEAHVAANAAMEAANHASHQANEHYGASKAAAMAAHHAYVENVNMGATNGYIH